jgi:N-acyl-D-aspartate/D-glutamate deacylase
MIGWEEAIYKMSGMPAKKFNLEKRGILTKGNFADVIVFDPKKICDKATMENPYQYCEGIEWVIVNGKAALRNGNVTGISAGEVIRRKK